MTINKPQGANSIGYILVVFRIVDNKADLRFCKTCIPAIFGGQSCHQGYMDVFTPYLVSPWMRPTVVQSHFVFFIVMGQYWSLAGMFK